MARRDTPAALEAKKGAYEAKLGAMTDEQLFAEAKRVIWLSAYANNNPRSDFHWMCDATYSEARRRSEDAAIYARAHRDVMRGEGYAG